jgi:hypothetical protein
MFGNMAWEPDAGPDAIVQSYSPAAWAAFINATFAAWAGMDPDLGAAVLEQYSNDSAPDPQKAYDAISTDVGLTCATPVVARAALAPAGRFTSPMYVFVNNWSPALPVPGWVPDYFALYAFHTWDLTCALEGWTEAGYTPQPSDVLHGQSLRTWWYQLAAYGALNASAGWAAVDAVPGWPATWGTFVIQPAASTAARNADGHASDALPGPVRVGGAGEKRGEEPWAPPAGTGATVTGAATSGSVTVVSYKAEQCAFWAAHGFDQRFWWCD